VDLTRTEVAARRRGAAARFGLLAVPVAFFAVFFAYPVAAIVARGLQVDGVWQFGRLWEVLGQSDIRHVLWFTTWQALASTALTLLIALPGAYAVSRLQFFGRRQVSVLFLAVYLFPPILLAVPLFVFFTRIGLRGTLVGLLIVYVSQVVAVSIYMLRNYFDTVPVSLEEAAAIDGCSRLGVMRRISLPLAMPAIVANALFIFMIAWNEFLFALLFLIEERDRWTVSLGLSQLAGSIEIPTTVLMAGSVIVTVPIIVVFFASERLLTEGLTAGAEKG
jgi:multiple sugar transport system permease protein